MANYTRSNVPFPNTFLTVSADDFRELLTNNANALYNAFLASGGGPITTVTLNAGDGSTIKLTGNFAVSIVSFSPPTGRMQGNLTGVSRDTPGGNIETLTSFSLPVDVTATQTAIISSNVDPRAILAGADQITGGSQDDVLTGLASADTINGGGGDDTVIFGLVPNEVVAGETINGGTGSDRILLGGFVDFTAATSIASIEKLDFRFTVGPNSPNSAIFGANQVGGGIAANLAVNGETSRHDTILFGMGAATALNLSGFTFADWGADDVIAISGDNDAETIVGSSRNDRISGSGGADVIDGGGGSDMADYSEKAAPLVIFLNGATAAVVRVNFADEDTLSNVESLTGGSGADVLVGDSQANTLFGGGGADYLFGPNFTPDGSFAPGSGVDMLDGEAGNDGVWGGDGADTLNGGDGDDGLVGGGDNDTMNGGAGTDFLFGGDFSLTDGSRLPNSGNDTLNGGADRDGLYGFDGDDMINGEAGNDYVEGGAGNDVISGGADDDELYGEGGNDTINGGDRNDSLYGADGDDTINGGAGVDFLYGGAFSPGGVQLANSGADTLNGGESEDGLYGFDGTDTINGDGGNDYMEGGAGADILNGGAGNDFVLGEGDNDTINGGVGFDFMYGGAGADTFIFRRGDNADWILDFNGAAVGGDKLSLEGFGFANFDAITFVDKSFGGNLAAELTVFNPIDSTFDQVTIFGASPEQLNATNVLVV